GSVEARDRGECGGPSVRSALRRTAGRCRGGDVELAAPARRGRTEGHPRAALLVKLRQRIRDVPARVQVGTVASRSPFSERDRTKHPKFAEAPSTSRAARVVSV